MRAESWGIYSGSFDPVHEGHLGIIRDALKNDKVDKLYIIVNISGGKNFKASYEDRKEMIRLATQEFGDRVEIFPVRQEMKTRFTIPLLKALNPGKPYFVYLGEDSFKVLPKHLDRDPLRTIRMSPRPAGSPSSTAARDAMAKGLAAPYLPAVVRAYAERVGLYGCGSNFSQVSP